MSTPYGESGLDFDAAFQSPEPTFTLIEPKTAPASMLERVRVNTEGRCLETDTSIGTVAVEMYYQTAGDEEEIRGDFFAPLSTDIDPDAGDNPLPTQVHPYTMLANGALYQAVVRVPLEAASAEWSAEKVRNLGGPLMSLDGMSLAQFRRNFPGVQVDLPEGQYRITAKERTMPTLAVLARVENGEPLARTQKIYGDTTHYTETLAGGFMPSGLRPDTAVAIVDSRLTIRDNNEADKQRLEFKVHDGFQRTGEGAAENSGAVELIVMQGEAVEFNGFTFTPHEPIKYTPPSSSYDNFDFGGFGRSRGSFDFTEPTKGGGVSGLIGGETRYRAPETVNVSMTGVRDLRAIAAFRFAMTGSQPRTLSE